MRKNKNGVSPEDSKDKLGSYLQKHFEDEAVRELMREIAIRESKTKDRGGRVTFKDVEQYRDFCVGREKTHS